MREFPQVVDRSRRRDLGDADPADAETADREVIGLAAELERPAAEVAAADEGDLHLLDPHGSRLLQVLGRSRAGCRKDENQAAP
jgi:hypothetical protein